MANQAFGMVIGAGGADVIIRAMTGLIKAKGGVVRVKSPVARIENDASGATGVQLGDGTRLAAKKAVIANLHPQIVFGRLMNPDPKRKAFDEKVAPHSRWPRHNDDSPCARSRRPTGALALT